VIYAGGAQVLLKSHGVKVGERVVVAGAGPLPIVVAAQLARAGVRVVAVATLQPVTPVLLQPLSLWAGRRVIAEGWQYLNLLRHNNVEFISRCVPVRADGDRHIDSVLLTRHDGTGRPVAGTERRISCDTLAINYGFTANSELALMAGAAYGYDPGRGGWLPVTDRFCRTSVDGVLVAGDGAGLRGSWVAEAEGRIAGATAACFYDKTVSLDQEMQKYLRQRAQQDRFQRIVQQLLQLPQGVWGWAEDDTLVCRCECVTRARIQHAVSQGHTTMNAIKRNTRAGMGWCGGRMCMQNVAAYASGGRPDPDLAPMTPRPLARPVSLQSLSRQETE
jgi:bacterioferritin-associated ferredoxin